LPYKIEKVALTADPKDNLSSHRLAVTVVSRLLRREYIVRKEKSGMRIGRLT
jgi:hypothetical protein